MDSPLQAQAKALHRLIPRAEDRAYYYEGHHAITELQAIAELQDFAEFASRSSSISQTSKQPQSSKPRTTDLSYNMSIIFQKGWPTWRTIHGDKSQETTFNIRLAMELKTEACQMKLSTDPAAVIAKARQASLGAAPNDFPDMWAEIEEGLIHIVYGSNNIESAGSSLGITTKLCRDVFRGKHVSIDIDESSSEYREHVNHLKQTQRKSDKPEVIRSRIEVIQHARALNFLVDQVVLQGHDLTEQLIIYAHAILCHGSGTDEVVPGKYRTHEVAVRYGKPGEKQKANVCLRASAVPRYMKDLMKNLRDDLAKAETAQEIDPYTLAARYHHHFAMIHPFGDGNGRMSRMILNVLLLKYAGHFSLFGSNNQEKDDYLELVRRGGKKFRDEDVEVEFEQQTSHRETARFILQSSQKGLENMWKWASQTEVELTHRV